MFLGACHREAAAAVRKFVGALRTRSIKFGNPMEHFGLISLPHQNFVIFISLNVD